MEDRKFLATEPVGKLLLKLALPTVAAQLINMLYNIVDRIYIGHIPGDGALALTGVGVCMPIILIVSAFAALVSNGGAPRASIFMGQQNMEKAEENLRYANLGFKEGVIPTSNVLEAQTAWLSAQSGKIDAQIDVKLSELYLNKSMGTLK